MENRIILVLHNHLDLGSRSRSMHLVTELMKKEKKNSKLSNETVDLHHRYTARYQNGSKIVMSSIKDNPVRKGSRYTHIYLDESITNMPNFNALLTELFFPHTVMYENSDNGVYIFDKNLNFKQMQ
ncbi:hypothetical protein Q7A53_05055 [Halobacillus rhizosphaerae]|uniref:hypothetical protein n=1 Tax=Halobacillus rhizosphaerae TaxID=3064889 RepID=UPI00398B5FA4